MICPGAAESRTRSKGSAGDRENKVKRKTEKGGIPVQL